MQQTTTTDTGALISSNRVEGTRVFDYNGNHVGTIKRLILEKVSGRAVYAVMSFGGFLGMGDREYPIPWQSLKYDTNLGGYVTGITAEQLNGAPGDGTDADWRNRDDERRLYDYYGAQYYWNDR